MSSTFLVFKRKFYKHLWLFRPLTYVITVALVILLAIGLAPTTKTIGGKLLKGPKLFLALINPAIDSLDSYRNRTNFLLLGVGGENHPGSDLTDSIMLISVDLVSGDTVLISLPRDIWVESLAAKLNTAYSYGENQQETGGLVLAKAAVSEIINQPVHYATVLDFSGFEKSIDVMGGLELNIPHSFIDDQYPIPGQEDAKVEADRYEPVEFKSGTQHLEGAMALKYVRSRYSDSEEGTDYARAQRQQRVILAFKDQLLSLTTILNPQKISTLYKLFRQSVKTDLPASAYADIFKLSLRAKNQIRTGVIDQGSQAEDLPALLYNPPISLYGTWVLLPIDNDWQAIHQYVEEFLYQNQSS